MSPRGKWQGLVTIISLNWPFYVCATVILGLSVWGIVASGEPLSRLACIGVAAGSMYFLGVSSAVSHIIYDRSDLYRWRWMDRALAGATTGRMILCHCGFDDMSAELRERWKDTAWLVLDHHDAAVMTEASIRRARKRFPPAPGTLAARYDEWPVEDGSADAVLGLLAIHELRSESERTAWFTEARRCLRPDGRVVLAEHTRDLANFLAFGPGFLHFHGATGWRRCWKAAGFRATDEFRVTPWVKVFVLAK